MKRSPPRGASTGRARCEPNGAATFAKSAENGTWVTNMIGCCVLGGGGLPALALTTPMSVTADWLPMIARKKNEIGVWAWAGPAVYVNEVTGPSVVGVNWSEQSS